MKKMMLAILMIVTTGTIGMAIPPEEPAEDFVEIYVSSLATPIGFHGVMSLTNFGENENLVTVWWRPHGTPPPVLPFFDLVRSYPLDPGDSIMVFPPDVDVFMVHPTSWSWSAAIVSREPGLAIAGYFFNDAGMVADALYLWKDPDDVHIGYLWSAEVAAEVEGILWP